MTAAANQPLRTVVSHFQSLIKSYLFLQYCIVCNRYLDDNHQILCKKCIQDLPRVKNSAISDQDHISSPLTGLYSHWEFSDAFQTIIHEIKYQRKPKLASYLGKIAAAACPISEEKEVDCILPIPLHPVKFRERGFNQSLYIASGISEVFGIPVFSDYLKRIRYTRTQTKLSRLERRTNMKNAFKVPTNTIEAVAGKRFLIVDDVYTTGATLQSAARTLLTSGAHSVFGFTLAVAILH